MLLIARHLYCGRMKILTARKWCCYGSEGIAILIYQHVLYDNFQQDREQ